MANRTVKLLDTDMSHWPPGTRHYAVSDGTFLAVDVDDEGPSPAMIAYVEQLEESKEFVPKPIEFRTRPTVIVQCNADGIAESLDVLHRSEPGTSFDDALAEAGFTVAPAG